VFKTLGSSGRKYQNKEHKNQVQSLNWEKQFVRVVGAW
jgi:hypothetical protein